MCGISDPYSNGWHLICTGQESHDIRKLNFPFNPTPGATNWPSSSGAKAASPRDCFKNIMTSKKSSTLDCKSSKILSEDDSKVDRPQPSWSYLFFLDGFGGTWGVWLCKNWCFNHVTLAMLWHVKGNVKFQSRPCQVYGRVCVWKHGWIECWVVKLCHKHSPLTIIAMKKWVTYCWWKKSCTT